MRRATGARHPVDLPAEGSGVVHSSARIRGALSIILGSGE
jgi:hypothetical protein